MTKTIFNTFWQSTIVNGEDFLQLNDEKKKRINFIIHAFYFFVFLTSVQTFSPFYQLPEWQTLIDSPHLFEPIWSVKWISLDHWEITVRFILIFFLLSSFLGVMLWRRSRLIRTLVSISFFFYLSLIFSFGKVDHYLHLTLIASFLLIFIPNKNQTDPNSKSLASIFFGIQTLTLLAYFVSGVFKLYGIIDQEMSGMRSALSTDSLAQTISKTSLAAENEYFFQSFILESPSFFYSIILTLGFLIEFFSIYVIFQPKLHRVWGLLLALLHVGILLTVGPDFVNQILFIGLFFIFSPFYNVSVDFTQDFIDLKQRIIQRLRNKTSQFTIYYDGECMMCSGFLKFISNYQLPDKLKISKLQSDRYAQVLKEKRDLSLLDTIVVIEEKQDGSLLIRTKADGISWVLAKVSKLYIPLRLIYRIFPFPGNVVYDIVARFRKKVDANNCPIPPENIRKAMI